MATNDDRTQPQQPTGPESASDDTSLALIEEQADRSIRRLWHDDRWFFSVIDVIGLLTDAPRPRMYWADMKRTIHREGFVQLLEKIQQLKMTASDGKQRLTDAADTETLLRIIQSVPSPKAEPVKQWLARVGAQRLEQATRPLDPDQARAEAAKIPRPPLDGPALALAEYYEQLAAIFRRQAAHEAQLAYVDARLGEYDDRIAEHDEQIGELHDRLESVEHVTRLVPETLERLGPQTLTSAHQATMKAMVKRLHDLTGISYATIQADLGDHFHVGTYRDIPDARWPEIATWFQTRITAGEKRRMH